MIEAPLFARALRELDDAAWGAFLRGLIADYADRRGVAGAIRAGTVPAEARIPAGATPSPDALAGLLAGLAELDLAAMEPEELGLLHERRLATGPARRRLQGSYYTPRPVAREILARTLLPILEELAESAKGAGSIRLVDPCCGAGLFLGEAFDLILRFRRARGEDPAIIVDDLCERQLFGVDLDPGATELAKAMLTFKAIDALGGTSVAPGGRARAQGLRWKVATGDALDPGWAPAGELRHGPARGGVPSPAAPGGFDWSRAFPEAQGGFDLVVGNPPYLSHRALPPGRRARLEHYETMSAGFDLAALFVEAGLRMLRPGGVLGYLVSNKFLAADYGEPLRRMLLDRYELREITDVSSLPLFRGAAAYPVILVAARPRADRPAAGEVVLSTAGAGQAAYGAGDERGARGARVDRALLRRLPRCILSPRLRTESADLVARLLAAGESIPARTIRCGIARTGFTRSLIATAAWERLPGDERVGWVPFLASGDVRRFSLRGERRIHASWLGAHHRATLEEPKLLVGGIGRGLAAAVDPGGHALGRVYYVTAGEAGESLDYLAALLNSQLLGWCYSLLFWSAHLAGDYLRVNGTYLATLPIVRTASLRGWRREAAARIAELARDESRRQGGRHDAEMETLVAPLYGLGPADRELVEADQKAWRHE